MPTTPQLVRKGYRFKGTGAVYTDGDVFERGVQFYEARGTVKARERIRGIVIVSVERVLPVTSPAYDVGATEDGVRVPQRPRESAGQYRFCRLFEVDIDGQVRLRSVRDRDLRAASK